MAGRILVPDLRAFDTNGDPISGAKLYSYQSGTTTNLAVYTADDLATPETNPVVADSAGRFPDLYAASETAYRIVVKDASGITLNDSDPVYAQGTGVNPSPLSKSADYTSASDDLNRTIYWTGTATHTLPLGTGLSAGFKLRDDNTGTGTITIATQGGDLIDGASSKALLPGGIGDVEWDGSGWKFAELGPAYGPESISFPASAMVPRVTNGAAYNIAELSTNKNMVRSMDFDAATIQYAQFSWKMPKSWDRGTIRAAFTWEHGSTTTNFGVVWGLQAVAMGDGDAHDAAFGTAQTVTDTGGTTSTVYISPTTSAITVAGSPASEDVVQFQVYREASNGSDTLAVNAKLTWVTLYYTTNAQTEA